MTAFVLLGAGELHRHFKVIYLIIILALRAWRHPAVKITSVLSDPVGPGLRALCSLSALLDIHLHGVLDLNAGLVAPGIMSEPLRGRPHAPSVNCRRVDHSQDGPSPRAFTTLSL